MKTQKVMRMRNDVKRAGGQMATDTGSVQIDTELPAFQGFRNRHMHKSVCNLFLQSVAVQLNAYDPMAASASSLHMSTIILTCFCIIVRWFS